MGAFPEEKQKLYLFPGCCTDRAGKEPCPRSQGCGVHTLTDKSHFLRAAWLVPSLSRVLITFSVKPVISLEESQTPSNSERI